MWDGCGNGESVTACVEGCGAEKGNVFVVGLFWSADVGGKECLFFKGCAYGFLKQAEV